MSYLASLQADISNSTAILWRAYNDTVLYPTYNNT